MIAGKSTRRPKAKKTGNGHGGARPNSGGARPGAGRPRKPRHFKNYDELVAEGAPSDQLDAAGWMFRALAVSGLEVMKDKDLLDKDRRSELRQISKSMVPLISKARLRAAEQAVKGDAAKIAAKVNPPVEPVPDDEPPVARPVQRARAAATPDAPLEPVPKPKEKP